MRQQNSKLSKEVEDLNERISRQQEDNNLNEQKGNELLNQMLKENKIELERKNNIINITIFERFNSKNDLKY